MADLVSVVIPAYNMEKYLDESIKSALLQSYPSLEIIVVDDCSVDQTGKIALNYQDKGVEYVRLEENGGVAAALKTGFERAKGDYIAFLSADDFYMDIGKTQKQVAIMKQQNADWSFYTGYYSGTRFDRKKMYRGSFIHGLGFMNPLILGDPDLMFMALLYSNPINSASMMITRECLQKGGNWDPRWRNADPDGDLFLRYCRKKLRCAAIDGAPLFYRVHEKQLSNNAQYMNENYEKVRLNALMQVKPGDLKTKMDKFRPFFWWYKITGIAKRKPGITKFLDEVAYQ